MSIFRADYYYVVRIPQLRVASTCEIYNNISFINFFKILLRRVENNSVEDFSIHYSTVKRKQARREVFSTRG